METYIPLLQFTIPAIIISGVGYIIFQKYFQHLSHLEHYAAKKEILKITVPLRLQAYERIVLYLERISPPAFVLNHHQSEMNYRHLQAILLKNIRIEYEHNQSQQIYLSSNAWEMVKKSRDEMTKIVNFAAEQVGKDASAMEYAHKILEICDSYHKLPQQEALEVIKAEIRNLF